MSDTILQALLDRWEVPFRNRTAYNALAKLQPFAVAGFKLDSNIAELAVATRLLFVAALHLNLFADGFTVRHARLLQCDLYPEFCPEFRDDHIQVLLAQTADNHLMGFCIVLKFNNRVFFYQAE